MTDAIPVYYWDACVLTSYIEDQPDRAPLIGLLLDDARAGKIEIVTSVISQAEVAYANVERVRQALNPVTEQKIDALWAPGSPIVTVEVYPLITARARNLIREGIPRNWTGLRAHDAIHLATAQQIGVDEMHTYETKLPRYAETLGFPITEPRTSELRII